MKKLCFALIVCLVIVSCKDREMRVNEFIANYNLETKKIRSSEIGSTKAVYKDKNEIIIEFEFSFLDDSIQMNFLAQSIANITAPMIKAVPQGENLLKDGVNFKLQLFNRNHVKFGEADINSKSVDISSGGNDLQSMIAELNKALPITDSLTGDKLLKIELQGNSVIYKYEVADDMSEIMDLSETDEILKEDLRSNPSIRSIFSNRAGVNINNIICIYFDKNNVELKKIALSKQDFYSQNVSRQTQTNKDFYWLLVLKKVKESLPIVEEKFSFKLTNVDRGPDNSMVSTYEIPDTYLTMLDMEEFDKTLKLGLLNSEFIHKILNTEEAGLEKVVTIYKNKNRKELKRFTTRKDEYNRLYKSRK